MKIIYFSYLYFVIANSSIITSEALMYKKVPDDIAKNIPSRIGFPSNKTIPNKIPIGVKILNRMIILHKLGCEVFDL